jgi:sigma-B regulation protein RsbU (phosphoserine phosphatase)
MKRWLQLSLLALPLAAQYPAGAVFQRGDDPRWAAPDFDDRQWVKQSDFRANSYDDYLQNRSWLRARVTIPAGEPAVIVSQHCPCEFHVNGLRVAAIGDLNQVRPYTPRGIRIFPLPASIPAGEAVFAVRRYDPPGLESVGFSWARSSALLVPASGADQALEQFEKTSLAPARLNILFVLFALAALLGATWGQRKDAAFWAAVLMEACSLLAVMANVLVSIGSADQSRMNSLGWSLATPVQILPAILLVLIVPGVNRRLWLPACLFAGAIRIPFFVALYYGVPPSWLPLAVAASEAGSWLIVVTTWALVTLALRLGGIPRLLLLFCALAPLTSLLARLAPKLQLPQQFFVFEVSWTWTRLSQLFFSLTVAALVIWRAQVRRRQELRQQEELAAAKEVQSLLLESPPQPHPEIQIETAYLPASGVGGDFYYVLLRPGLRRRLAGGAGRRCQRQGLEGGDGGLRLYRFTATRRLLVARGDPGGPQSNARRQGRWRLRHLLLRAVHSRRRGDRGLRRPSGSLAGRPRSGARRRVAAGSCRPCGVRRELYSIGARAAAHAGL